MSFKHMAWAFNAHVGDPMAKLLLLALADRADKETGQCYPSLARLCQDTEMSMATVTRRLIFLEENKFIIRTQRDRTSTLYTLLLTESTPLSDREKQILQLVAESYSTKEIAARLNISVRTVDNHRTNIMRKLNLHDVAALTRYAIKNELVSLS